MSGPRGLFLDIDGRKVDILAARRSPRISVAHSSGRCGGPRAGDDVRRSQTLAVILLAGALVTPVAAVAQELYTFTGSFLGGLGGSFDENDAGFGNPSFQLGFSNVIEKRTHVGFRLGYVGFDSDSYVGELKGASLAYLNVSGEYRSAKSSFSGSFVDSGIYIGLGGYQLSGDTDDGGSESGSSIGLVLGLTGDIEVSPSFAVRLELSGHILSSDVARYFGLAQVGLAYRF